MQSDRSASRARPWAALAMAIAAVAGCGGLGGKFEFRGTTARSFLRTIRESDDPNARYAAYDKLGSASAFDDDGQKAEAAQLLVSRMKAGKEPVATRAVICRTLGTLRQPESRRAILAATEDDDPLVRAEACRALGRVGRTEDATILARVMTLDQTSECRIAAIESLGELKAQDRRIDEYLVSGMEHDDPAIRVACLHALRSITGKDLGVEAEPWKKYVESLPRTAPPAAVEPERPASPAPVTAPPANDPYPVPGPGDLAGGGRVDPDARPASAPPR